jgi:isoleucyl-tRNA synthetase
MHKSLGNSISPDDIVKKYGAELVRLWAASSDYHADVRCSDNIFKQLSESYRKIRNTARIMMANLGDFNPDTDMVEINELCDIDKWALSRVNELTKTVRKAYDEYEFHIVYHAINNFCTTDMSKLYVDITKDRVYTEKADGKLRRSAQTAMWIVLSAMTRLLAPLISFTAEEIWQSMPHKATDNTESVFLNDLPVYTDEFSFTEIEESWGKLFELRDDVMKALEIARAEKLIGKSLDAAVTVYTDNDDVYALFDSFKADLTTVYIVSDVKLVKGAAPAGVFTETVSGIGLKVEVAAGERCDRCWMHTDAPISDGEGVLCPRCAKVIGE